MKTVIKAMHEDFQIRSGLDNVSFYNWLDRIVQNFVPAALVGALDQEKKKNIIATVVTDIVERLSFKFINHQWLIKIIDERCEESASFLMSEVVDIVWIVKEETFQKFISIRSDNKGVSYETAKKMHETIDKLTNQVKCDMKLCHKMQQIIALKNEAILKKDLELQTVKSDLNQAEMQTKIIQAKYDKLIAEKQAVPPPAPLKPRAASPIKTVPQVQTEDESALKEKLIEMEEKIKEMESLAKKDNVVERVNKQIEFIENTNNNNDDEDDVISMKDIDFGF